MNFFSRVKAYISETRNQAVASSQMMKTPEPIYNDWSIQKAVEEGYKANPWVYRSVYLKAKAGSSVPWYVQNKEGEKIEEHHLTKLFQFPNPNISRQDLMELVISWLDLSGNSYLKKAGPQNRTAELWPISPDKMRPVPTKDVDKWLDGYAFDKSKTSTFKPEEIIHHKYFNPSNPLLGISPLQAVAKAVDIDNSQKDFNRSTSQNRGVIDGIFSFDRTFETQEQTDAIADKLNERHKGKRAFGVLGSNAKYTRTALTPAEMDFIQSGKAIREEIFIAFGVPPVYAGVMEGATMNNYKTSELIFWFGTMLFLLDDLKDTFNFSFRTELNPGETIVYDISGVPAIREAVLSKAKTAKLLFEMGVPFEQLNKVFGLGFQDFEGWDQSFVKTQGGGSDFANDSATRSAIKSEMERRMQKTKPKYTLIENRSNNIQDEIEKRALRNQKVFFDLLKTQQEAIFDLLASNINGNVEKKIQESRTLWIDNMNQLYIQEGVFFGQEMVIEKRGIEKDLEFQIENYIKSEGMVLKEISLVNSTTVDKLLLQVRNAIDKGLNINDLQQSIFDSGIFSEKRALMLSRTITGTAANLGQIHGAVLGGANVKEWDTAGFEVRKSHKKMQGVTIPIDEYFIVGGEKALHP